MKIVNDVRIAVGLESQHFRQTRPTMTRSNDCVPWRPGANRGGQLCPNPVPAIRVLNHRSVDRLEEYHFRIARRQVFGERAPKLRKFATCRLSFSRSLNSSAGWMSTITASRWAKIRSSAASK